MCTKKFPEALLPNLCKFKVRSFLSLAPQQKNPDSTLGATCL